MRSPAFARRLTLELLGVLVSGLAACAPAAAPAPTSPPAPPATAAAKPAASPLAIASAVSSPSAAAAPQLASSPSASPAASPSAAASGAVAPRPANVTLHITSPTAGQNLPAGTISVNVQYVGPPLVAAANASKLDDYHLHYFLDDSAAPYLGTMVPVPMGNPHIVHTAALQLTFDNVTAGPHTLTVMLSGSNHISVNPPLSDQVAFTVS